jgi:hypothetical protein
MIHAVVNGVFTSGESVCCVAPEGKLHLVLLPMAHRQGTFRCLWPSIHQEEEFESDGSAPITLCKDTDRILLTFTETKRFVDSCLSTALRSAVKCLQLDDQTQPRIGSLNSAELSKVVLQALGEDRASFRFMDESWLRGFQEISAFTGKDSETACVARKSCHRWVGGKPRLPGCDVNFCDIICLSNSDALGWRRLAASFSTMMRYFQKLKAEFSWSSNDENKTIIRLAKGMM